MLRLRVKAIFRESSAVWSPHTKAPTPLLALLAVCVCLVAIGVLDYATGVALSFSLFYLLPVMLAGRWLGYRAGIWVACLCALAWYVIESIAQTTERSQWVALWNGLVRLCFFLLFNHMQQVILSALAREQQLARTDDLTGAMNSRQFHEQLNQEIVRHQRFNQWLTLAYVDVDNFKAANDKGGHRLGDALLQRVVQVCQSTLRRVDSVARLGGDEFALLLPQTDAQAAQKALTNLQAVINAQFAEQSPSVTVSIGAVSCQQPALSADALLSMADTLMYRVKQRGKNGLICQAISAAAADASGERSLQD